MAMAGVEAAVSEKDEGVGLAAGEGAGSIEIKIVDVDVAVLVGFSVSGVKDNAAGEGFGALGAELEHFAHGGIAINIGVATFDVRIFGSIGVRNSAVDIHKVGFGTADAVTLLAVSNIFFGGLFKGRF